MLHKSLRLLRFTLDLLFLQADEEFLSMFDGDDIDGINEEKVLTLPGYPLGYSDSGANYAGVCMQSKLTVQFSAIIAFVLM